MIGSIYKILISVCLAIVAMVAVSAVPGHAAVVGYNFSWTGGGVAGGSVFGDYSMTGMFTFDDATAGSTVTDSELLSFMMEGFGPSGSLGTFSGSGADPSFNAVMEFNFDTGTESFLVGGLFPPLVQEWNDVFGTSTGIGFNTGSGSSQLVFDGAVIIPSIHVPFDITVTPKAVSQVPLPAALPLLAGGLGLMGLVSWRRRRKTAASG